MKIENRLQNGLTLEQSDKARELFMRVNMSKICKELKISTATTYGVLKGVNFNVRKLQLAIEAANLEIEKRKQLADSLHL